MINLHNMDCMTALRDIPDKAYELAIVDPPYRDFNQPDQWLRANNGDMKKWPPAPDGRYFSELSRVAKEFIIWGGNYFTHYLAPNNNWIVWHKLNEGVHFSMCELAYCTIRKNVQLYRRLPEKDKINPCQKPVALYEWLLKNYAKLGDRILDTHLGSGSIAIACHNMGFDLDGYELDRDYYEAAVRRLEDHKRQGILFEPKEIF